MRQSHAQSALAGGSTLGRWKHSYLHAHGCCGNACPINPYAHVSRCNSITMGTATPHGRWGWQSSLAFRNAPGLRQLWLARLSVHIHLLTGGITCSRAAGEATPATCEGFHSTSSPITSLPASCCSAAAQPSASSTHRTASAGRLSCR